MTTARLEHWHHPLKEVAPHCDTACLSDFFCVWDDDWGPHDGEDTVVTIETHDGVAVQWCWGVADADTSNWYDWGPPQLWPRAH